MDWRTDGTHWPHADKSRFVESAGQRWHVQQWPGPGPGPGREAPTWLLLHGTGASTHSWHALAPLLAERVGVLAIDLPGHAFSGPAPWGGASMPGMARAVRELLRGLQVAPAVVLGHSAGAAIALRMALQDAASAPLIVALNAAVFPLPGLAGAIFPPAAKLLAFNPYVPHFFAWRAGQPKVLQRLLDSTGSQVDAEGQRLYGRLVADPAHVAGALAMMAAWDLAALARELPRVPVPVHWVVAEADRTVPPADAARAQTLLPGSKLHRLPGLGHLAHEEAPQTVLDLLRRTDLGLGLGTDVAFDRPPLAAQKQA
jgi:magnesium chelatase accessory protein